MPPKVKTEQEKQHLKTLIIDAARDLFIRKGVEAVSMRQIAKQIGYSATSIYLHFTDKDGLLRAICETDCIALASTFEGVMKITNPVERMVALGQAYVDFALSHPNHYRLMFMTPRPAVAIESDDAREHSTEQNAYLLLKTVVTAVYDAKCFRGDLTDVDLIAQTIWAGMHGVCALHITMEKDDWVQWSGLRERVYLMQKVMMRGLMRG